MRRALTETKLLKLMSNFALDRFRRSYRQVWRKDRRCTKNPFIPLLQIHLIHQFYPSFTFLIPLRNKVVVYNWRVVIYFTCVDVRSCSVWLVHVARRAGRGVLDICRSGFVVHVVAASSVLLRWNSNNSNNSNNKLTLL